MENYALLVGINRYEKPGNDLAGCWNDISDIRAYLLSKGWDPAKIFVLKDAQATKAGIVTGLNWLLGTGGRELLFWYSGHGSQVPSTDPEEPDHKNEVICPYDYHKYWHQPLGDDALKEIFRAKRPESFLTVVLDACHSQDGTRAGNRPQAGRSFRNRYQTAPREDPRPDSQAPLNRFGVKQKGFYQETAEDMNHVLLSACLSLQTAADTEFHGRPNGAWSWALVRCLRESTNPMTNHDLHRHASLLVRSEGFSQRPCLEGKTDLCNRTFLGG